MAALVVGSVLAVLGLMYVLWPVVRGTVGSNAPTTGPDVPDEASALDALREIEFDQATGKLSADDYAALRAEYTPLALAELKAREGSVVARAAEVMALEPAGQGERTNADLDPAEQLIARAKARARYCPACGEKVVSVEARFCTECGGSLAA